MSLLTLELLALVVFAETARRVYKFLRNKNFVRKTIIGEDYKWVFSVSPDRRQPVHHRPIIREIVHSTDEEEREWWNNVFVAFGPYYRGLESDAWKTAKDEAWKHVLRNSKDEGDESETTRRYTESMRTVEREARRLYGEDSLLTSDEFIWIMILDGCFLLQVALFVLGGSKQLAHSTDDPIFGHPGNKALIRAAMSSMFIVGNQIPNLVLKELMKQSFFKEVFNHGIWQQPLDLERWVLFKLLLVPLLDAKTGGRGPLLLPTAWLCDYALLKRLMSKPWWILHSCKLGGIVKSLRFSLKLSLYSLINKVPLEDANDLLHGLWLLMTGLKLNSKGTEMDNVDQDIENIIGDSISSSSDYFDDIVLPAVRSATELKEAGVGFKCHKKRGTTKIRFENVFFNAFLCLPQITIDCGSEMLLRNLMYYEVTQGLGEKNRKICAYLQLMRELLRSSEDAKLLARSGVILVDPKQEEKLPKLFQELPIPKVKPNTSLNKVRYELTNYTQPNMFRQKLSDILSFVILLAIIQTVYAILSFHLRK